MTATPVPADFVESDLEVHLDLMGDWGIANWHAVAGWLAAGLRWRTAPGSRFLIHTIGEYLEPCFSVVDGTVDLCVSTPVITTQMLREGRGPFTEAHPELRAIAALPHRDRLALAIGEDVCERYGIRTFADLAEKRPPLKLVTAAHNGVNIISWTAERVLEAYGIEWDDIERWGGRWISVEQPMRGMQMVRSGEADGMFAEAIMTWRSLMEARPLRLVPVDAAVLDQLGRDHGFGAAVVHGAEYPGDNGDVPTVDFSQWLLVVRDEMASEVAGLLARVVVEDAPALERKFRNTPREESALYYPIRADDVCRTEPVPLHAGAEAYYREIGALGPM